MLITSKRNNNEYSFQELIQKALSSKSNLVIEFTKVNDIYQMKLFDPLGNVWYIGTDIEAFVKSLVDRLLFSVVEEVPIICSAFTLKGTPTCKVISKHITITNAKTRLIALLIIQISSP
jgi:hypothetical protein